MATLQETTEARQDTTLNQRIYSHLVDISNDILGESPTVDHHWLRVVIIDFILNKPAKGNQIAKAMQDRGISEAAFTLPLDYDTSTPPQQIAPTDLEITSAVDSYMATPEFLKDIVINL